MQGGDLNRQRRCHQRCCRHRNAVVVNVNGVNGVEDNNAVDDNAVDDNAVDVRQRRCHQRRCRQRRWRQRRCRQRRCCRQRRWWQCRWRQRRWRTTTALSSTALSSTALMTTLLTTTALSSTALSSTSTALSSRALSSTALSAIRKAHKPLNILSQRLTDLPAPINISLWWNYGSLLGLFLIIQIIRGIFLSIHYCPNIELAFSSLYYTKCELRMSYPQYTHKRSIQVFTVDIYSHGPRNILYVILYNKNLKHRSNHFHLYNNNCLHRLCPSMGPNKFLSSYRYYEHWNIFSAIPYLGNYTVSWLWGGFAVSNATLNRFFILHFLLPFIILLLIILHFINTWNRLQ